MKKNNKILLSVFLCLWAFSCIAQQPYMRNIADEDGLPSLTVYDIFQDSRDYIWIGTDKGLCRYDGQKFRYYYNENQKGASFDGITEDKNGQVWCKNFNSQVFFIVQDSLHLLEMLDSIPNINSFVVDCSDDLLLQTNNHIWKYNTKQQNIKEVQVGNTKEIFDDIECSKAILGYGGILMDTCDFWIVRWNARPMKLDQKGKSTRFVCSNCRYTETKCLNCDSSSQLSYKCPYMLKSYKGKTKILFTEQPNNSSEKYKIYYLRGDSIAEINTLNKALEGNVIGVYEDNDNKIWVYTYNGAIMVNGVEDPFIQKYLNKFFVSKVLQDREGNYWFGTLGNGVFFMPHLATYHFEGADLGIKTENIKKLAVIDTSTLVIGTSTLTHPVLNTTTLEVKNNLLSIIAAENEAMAYDNYSHTLYLQQGTFLTTKKAHENTEFTPSGSVPNIKNFFFFENDFMLVGTRLGAHLSLKDIDKQADELVYKLTNTDSSSFVFNAGYTKYMFPHKSRCNAVYASGFRKFWLGYSDTLMYFSEGRNYPILAEDDENILARDIVGTLGNIIWVGTANRGLYMIKDSTVLYHFTPSNGLISKNVITLKADGNGLWIGTDKGLQYLDKTHTLFNTYNRADGLISDEINDIELLGGKVWLATPKGLISFDKDMPSVNNYAPPIYLTQIAINGEDTALFARYELPHHRNNFFISFEGIAYRSQGNFRYKYRMEGLSEEWIYVNSAQNELRFMSLNPGDYQLEIYAVNEDGVESRSPIVIDFCIHPPYWQTWWFWTLMGGGLFLAAAGITWWQFSVYRRRQAMLMQMQQLRTQALQSQMNPHFIFNAMNAIQKLMVKDTMENALSYMAKFAKLIRMIFEISGQSAVALEEEVTFLKLYLDLEKLRFKNKVMIDFQIDEALWDDFYFIPPLLIQPIIENSFKHGLMHKEELGNLSVVFKKEGTFLYVRVEDNGVGRKRAAELSEWKREKRKKSGLVVTEERLAMLPSYPEHPQNFLVTDLYGEKGEAVGVRTELWISFTEPENANMPEGE